MPKKILLIDDEELITRTLANSLERAGYDVLVAKSGNDAIVMAEEEDFDLVVSDIRMPGLNGVETVRRILDVIQKKGGGKTPTIFVTGYADQAVEKQARALRPDAYPNFASFKSEFVVNIEVTTTRPPKLALHF